MISDVFLTLTSYATVFLAGEFIEWLLLVHDDAGWKFRFFSPEDYPQLRPVIATFTVALILFFMVLLISPFLLPQIWNSVVVNLVQSSKYWLLLFVGSIIFTFFWIWHHIVGKDWNWEQIALLVTSFVFFGIYLWINLT